jgi:hypothetical protein
MKTIVNRNLNIYRCVLWRKPSSAAEFFENVIVLIISPLGKTLSCGPESEIFMLIDWREA